MPQSKNRAVSNREITKITKQTLEQLDMTWEEGQSENCNKYMWFRTEIDSLMTRVKSQFGFFSWLKKEVKKWGKIEQHM